jgi:phosphomevalonate decarboxylase
MYKARARAYAMQALVKYHGLKDWELRIPYHDSISVNMDAVYTETEIEFRREFEKDSFFVDGHELTGTELQRVLKVVDVVRKMSGIEAYKFRGISNNNIPNAKGLGFSSSAGAALALASVKASMLDEKMNWQNLDYSYLSRIARRFAGSASRSIVGEYARWYAGKDDETSYAKKIASRETLDLGTVVAPIESELKTEEAHREVEKSPFFKTRNETAQRRCDEMQDAILKHDLERVCELAEVDTLELHSTTMTGGSGLVVYKPESLKVIQLVRRMRSEERVPVYYSMQTGPSVFINTYSEKTRAIMKAVTKEGISCFVSSVGPEARIIG